MDSPRDDLQSLPEGIEALRALVLRRLPIATQHLSSAMRRSPSGTFCWHRMTGCVICCCSSDACISAPARSVCRRNSCNWAWKPSSRRSPKKTRRRRSAIPSWRRDNAAKRRASRGALPAHLPRIEVTLAPEDTACPCCRATHDGDRRGHLGAAGCDPGAVSGDRDQASEARLPGLHGHRRAGTGAGAADRGRHPDRGDGRPCAGGTLCRSSAAVSPGADPGAAGRDPRAVHPVVLDGIRRGRSRPSGGAAARDDAGLDTDLCRRDRRAGARSRPRTDQAGILLGDCA